jgi:hypothetical protein
MLCVYVPVAVAQYLIVLAVIHIYVIYKCLSWAGDRQAKLKTAKPSHQWQAVKRPIPYGE